MAFTTLICTSFAVLVCVNAHPLSYLRDNNNGQSGLPFQNQPFVYLRDNGVNQPLQSGPSNYINNIVGGASQIQTVGYPSIVNSAGYVQYPGNALSSNIVNNVNSVNSLPVAQYPTAIAQTVPIVNYPSVPYAVQPNIIGGIPQSFGGYQQSQITNTQTAPVEVNFQSSPCY